MLLIVVLWLAGCGAPDEVEVEPIVVAAVDEAHDTDGFKMARKPIVMPDNATPEWVERPYRVAGAPQWKGDLLVLPVETGAGCGKDRFSLRLDKRSPTPGLVDLTVVREHSGPECKAVSIEEITLDVGPLLDPEVCTQGILLHMPAKDPAEVRFVTPRGKCP